MPKKKKDDPYLAFVHEVLGLQSLHFGLFSEDMPTTLDGLKQAQTAYTTMLIGLIPDDCKTVLDVGAGLGDTSVRLKGMGRKPEGLSPDDYLGKMFTKTCGEDVPFHRSTFEAFKPGKTYDCLLFSESPQYIDKDAFFPKALELLTEKGHMVVADFFKPYKDKGYPNSFIVEDFEKRAKETGFEIVKHNDITQNILPSMDLGMEFIRSGQGLYKLATQGATENNPILSRIAGFFLRKKLRTVEHYLFEKLPDHLDRVKFAKEMNYSMYHLARK